MHYMYVLLVAYVIMGVYTSYNLERYFGGEEITLADRFLAIIGWPLVIFNEKF